MTLKQSLRQVSRRAGYDVVPFDHRRHPLARRMRLLATHGVNLVFDIGANSGQYASELRTYGYRGRIISFEPLSSAFAELRAHAATDPAWKTVNVAVGDESGTAVIHVAAFSPASSFLRVLPRSTGVVPQTAAVTEEAVRVEILQTLVERYADAKDRLFLKLDVQGFERRILQSSHDAMRKAVGIQLEMSLVPLYDGEALITEMLQLVEGFGFRLMSLEPGLADPVSGQLLQTDAIFFRE
jgi:FkbM family methyltransferase